MRIAFVHDWLTSYGGAERVLEAMLRLYPDAPVYTLLYDQKHFQNSPISERTIYTSFIQRLPFSRTRYRAYLPIMPLAIEQFDLSEYDMVISSSHAVAKGIVTRGDQLHISYVHTPIRYAWDLHFQYLRESRIEHGLKTILARAILHYIRLWDRLSADRVDLFVANSHYVARRIAKVYRRKANVIYPPVDVENFTCKPKRDSFYLTVSRLVPYKKIDLIIAAFTKLGLPLVVIGDGPDYRRLKHLAGPNVKLLGYQPDSVVRELMENCKAFVFSADEDFGIAPVEAQAAGAPVIAFAKGGVTETVIPGETGLFFREQTVESLVEAVRAFESGMYHFDPKLVRRNAERFSTARFLKEFADLVDTQKRVLLEYRSGVVNDE